MTAASNKYKSIQETCRVTCWLWRRIGLIERCREKSWKAERGKQRRADAYGCNGGSSFSNFLLVVTILHTQRENERMDFDTLLFLEIDCFNLEVNKHHACLQHPNPELLEIGTLQLPPTGKPRLGFQNSYFYVLAISILLKQNMWSPAPNCLLKAAFVESKLILKERLIPLWRQVQLCDRRWKRVN